MIAAFPGSRTGHPRSAPALRWGVLAPGNIATVFVMALQRHTSQHVVAVGSRSLERGTDFAGRFGIPRVHVGYQDLVADPDVDVVYIASRQADHLEHGLLAMVAMWTRYLPQTDILRQLLDAGALGEITGLAADHGQAIPADSWLWSTNPGGGALLDLGIYPYSFASMVLGTPRSIAVTGSLAESGVDRQSTVVLGYDGGAETVLSTTLAGLCLASTPAVGLTVCLVGRRRCGGNGKASSPIRPLTARFVLILTTRLSAAAISRN